MIARTYHGRTMKEALARVRRDLGGDAVILAAREVRRRRILGLASRELIEVTATATMPAGSNSTTAGNSAATRTASPPPPNLLSPAARARFGDELCELHDVVEALLRQGRIDHLIPEVPSELVPLYARLLEAEVPEFLARQLVRMLADDLEPDELSSPRAVQAALAELIERCIPIAPPIRAVRGTRRVVTLIGPTGVGKTTTIAKLAANFKLVHGVRLGLLTLDTYRIAAVEQLRTYAEILDLPLAVVDRPGGMEAALQSLGAVDLVLIDTTGRSPRDEVKIGELASSLSLARPDEVHLVLSAAASPRSLKAAVDRFDRVRVDRLILTKLDEAEALGPVLGLLSQGCPPLSYLTTGQGVPDDIEPADRKRLARLILEAEDVASSAIQPEEDTR